jgi:GNAT superfamily N-acetyltransferase
MDGPTTVRPLGAAELEAFLGHMTRLDAGARALRFCAGVDDYFILSHCLAMVVARTSLVGALVGNEVRGAAEIEVDDDGEVGEVYLTVEREWRGQGLCLALTGSALEEARRPGGGRLRIDSDIANEAMHKIARKNGFLAEGGRRTVTYGLALRQATQERREPVGRLWWNPFRAGARTA